jgi:hypothetical protein
MVGEGQSLFFVLFSKGKMPHYKYKYNMQYPDTILWREYSIV